MPAGLLVASYLFSTPSLFSTSALCPQSPRLSSAVCQLLSAEPDSLSTATSFPLSRPRCHWLPSWISLLDFCARSLFLWFRTDSASEFGIQDLCLLEARLDSCFLVSIGPNKDPASFYWVAAMMNTVVVAEEWEVVDYCASSNPQLCRRNSSLSLFACWLYLYFSFFKSSLSGQP